MYHHRQGHPLRPAKSIVIEALESRQLLTTTTLSTLPALLSTEANFVQMPTELAANGASSGTFALPASYAFVHPSITTTLEDLDTIKANLNQDPWKSGYAKLAADGRSSLNYTMQGPFANVSRAGSYDANLGAWRNDMTAVYNLARMWYFTGNAAYAQKGRDILIAWANTHTSFSGNESGLDLGDYAAAFGGGADILRGTWSGWTAADTTTVKNYFSNVFWKASAGWNVQGPANKGAIYMEAGIAIAVFCDDTAKFNHIVDQMRTFHGSGLMDTLPTGQLAETGRDAGHAFGMLNALAFVAEVAWKQGVDLYSELDNRLLACGEYYARNTFTTDNPYVFMGSIDWQWINNTPGPYTANRSAFYILQNAYKNRKGLPTPWIDRKLQEQPADGNNFMFAKTADFTTATAAPASFPTVSPASSGLTLTTLGTQTAGRSVSYSNGVWTLTGLGNGVWSDTTDDAQFAYTTMTGDGAMVAKVNSFTNSGTQAGKAGLMIRDNLSSTISQRGLVDVTWDSSGGNAIEAHMRGWTENWGGGGYDDRSHTWPPGIPYWIKIERRGKQITTFASPDGASWSPLTCTYYGNLPSTLYLGLFLCSGTTTAQTATFSNVAFTGGTGGLVTTPAAPVGVLASGSNKSITVRWLQSYGATSYDLLRSTTSGSGYTLIASNLSTDKTSYVDTAVSAGTTYYYVLQAKNSAGTSGNSPQFSAALLSAPLVNLAFSGTATASYTNTNPLEVPAEAFDGDPGSKWFGSASPTGWLQKDFGANNAQVVKQYTINSADVATRDPKDWTLLGSHDGVTWATLDTETGQLFAYRMQQNTYSITNTTAYRYYRLNVTANNGATSMAIAELGLWSDSGRTLPDGTYVLDNRQSQKVVDLSADGTKAIQQSWTGGNTQQWALAWQGNGVYRATNVSSGKVIDNGGNPGAGSNLAVNSWSGATSQLWKIVPDSDGFYHITSANSGLVMDVSGGLIADGANIVQSNYTGGDSQLWMPGFSAVPQPTPLVPTGLTAMPAGISTINLSWIASAGAVNYNIKRASVSGGPYTTIATGINTTSYSDTYLTAGTAYYYVVSAMNGSGESGNSAQANATTLTGAPAAPTGLTVLRGNNQATLNWTSTAGATSYTLKRAPSSGGPYTTIATNVTSTTYTETGLTNGVSYYYVVAADNAYGESPNSGEVNVTPSDLAALLKFDESSGTTANDAAGNNWPGTLVAGPVWSSTGRINGDVVLDGTDDYVSLPTGVVSGLDSITISTWVNLSAVANWQRIFDFGTGTNNYMFLSPKNGANSKVRFAILTPNSGGEQIIDGTAALPTGAWTHVAVTLNGAVGTLYVNGTQVGQKTNMTVNAASLGNTTRNYLGKSQFNDPYFKGQLDDFRIYNRPLTSAEISALANTTTIPATPTNLIATPGNAQVALNWSPAAGAASYAVLRSSMSGGPYATVAAGLVETSWNDTSVANQSNYFYVVRGSNIVGDSGNSNEASVMPNAAPTVASAASVALNSVTSTTAALGVLGADDAGEADLLYSWSANGPASVVFSDGGTHSASSVNATFTMAGAYTLTATITDAQGLSTTSSIGVNVAQTLSNIAVSPASSQVASGASQQLSATAYDQFGTAMSVQSAFSWSVVSGGGLIDSSGLYTAGYIAGVSSVKASSGLISDTASITTVNATPTIVSPASSFANPITTTTAVLSVLGGDSDGGGEPNLIYTWSVTGTPPAAVSFSGNNSNASKMTTVSFSKAGSYTLQVTATDLGGLFIQSNVIVTVNQTLSSITILPSNNPSVFSGSTLQFSASGSDQFGNTMTVAPAWSSTSGTISAAGLLTAGSTAGAFSVTASSGSVSATAPVTVVNASLFTGEIDLGNATTRPGSYSLASNVYSVKGAGSDIYTTSDHFHYVYVPFTGDGQIIARVSSVQNTNAWAKSGLMFRETLSANSRNAFIAVTPSQGVTFQRRTSVGGNTSYTQKTGIAAPEWAKLVRSGNLFQAFYSANGTTWTQLGSNQTIAMTSSIYVGLAVTSHNSTALSTATFDNVSITPYTNLASGKSATASSVATGSSAANAIDGNTSTAWTSVAAGSQNLVVDLGSAKSISRIKLAWGPNYGKNYSIQLSTNNSTWTSVYSSNNGSGGTVDVAGLLVVARYVKLGLNSGNSSNYIVNDLSIFGA